jgi:predicted KAP-like P-loop ATPase
VKAFAADRPIERQDEDSLGRGSFAKHLATAIARWEGTESLVLGLYGPWGAGKTSVKNLVLAALNADVPAESRPDVLEFNPWDASAKGPLVGQFIQELGAKLGVGDRAERSKALAKRFRSWSAAVGVYATGAEGLRSILSSVLITVAIAFWVGWTRAGIAAALGILCLAGAIVLNLARGLSEAVAVWYEKRAEGLQKSLQERKQELATELRKRPKTILIVFDDLDRLPAAEVRTVVQLVKGHADLPKLTYLLICQREVIERSLKDDANPDGAEFLKKIVQLPFDLPMATREQLNKMLFARLNGIIADVPPTSFNSERWGNLFVGGLQSFFRTPRDINRFAAALEFQIGLLGGPKNLEVDLVDLIGMEALRVFHSSVFQHLPPLKRVLVKGQSSAWVGGTDEEGKRLVAGLIESAPEEARSPVQEVLTRLFPPISALLGGTGYGPGFAEEWAREYRVCAEPTFDRYFAFAIPAGDISKMELDSVISALPDREALVRIFLSFHERGLLSVLMDRLENFKSDLPLGPAGSFITALFDVGELLPDDRGATLISPLMQASRVVHWYLRREPSEERREEVIRKAIEASVGLVLPCERVAMEERRADYTREVYLIRESSLPEFRFLCVRKVEAAAQGGRLGSNPHLGRVLYLWKRWGSHNAVRDWATGFATSGGAPKLLEALVPKGWSQGFADHVARPHWMVRLSDLEEFIPAALLQAEMSKVPPADLSGDQRELGRLLDKALARRAAGVPDNTEVESGGWDNDIAQ